MTLEDQPDQRAHRVLSNKTIWIASAVVVLVAAGAVVGLLLTLGGGSPQDTARLDAIKTAASIVVGTGGAAALLLAARRQRSAELDLEHKERVATANEHDATERRVTELYTKAAEQLGIDKDPVVRLAGLYALERIGQASPEHQQNVVNIICAYLRMPFTLLETSPKSANSGHGVVHNPKSRPARIQPQPIPPQVDSRKNEQRELLARTAAQQILLDHLQPGHSKDGNQLNPKFWKDIDLNLSDATLVSFDLSNCVVRHANFSGTYFAHDAHFSETTFSGVARFDKAHFAGFSRMGGTRFESWAVFTEARFFAATFARAEFLHNTQFNYASFYGRVTILWATFAGTVLFEETHFRAPLDPKIDDEIWVRIDEEEVARSWPEGWVVCTPEDEAARHRPGWEGVWGRLVPRQQGDSSPSDDQLGPPEGGDD